MTYKRALRNVKQIVDTYRGKGEYDEAQLLYIEITNLRMQLKRALTAEEVITKSMTEYEAALEQGKEYQRTGDVRAFLRSPFAGPISYDPALAIKACACGWDGKGSGGGAITQGDKCPDCGAQLW
jgi:hypothetical protein